MFFSANWLMTLDNGRTLGSDMMVNYTISFVIFFALVILSSVVYAQFSAVLFSARFNKKSPFNQCLYLVSLI